MKSRNQLLHQKTNQMNLDSKAGENDSDNTGSRTDNTPEMPNDSPQVINPIKDGSQGQNVGDNTSNNDQPIHNSNKSDKTVKDSNPKTETDQSSTNNSTETPNNSSTPPAPMTEPKESHKEVASRLTKKLLKNRSDSVNSSMHKSMNDSNKNKIYNFMSQNGIIYFLYKALSKYGESIKDELNSKESARKINKELYDSFRIVSVSWNENKDYFSKCGLDDIFLNDLLEFFDLLPTIVADYNDGENDNKNKVDELFKKTKSKLEKAYKKNI